MKTCRKLDISLQHPFFIHPIQIKLEIKIYPIDFVDPGEDPTLLKLVKDLFLDEKTSDFKVAYLSSTFQTKAWNYYYYTLPRNELLCQLFRGLR